MEVQLMHDSISSAALSAKNKNKQRQQSSEELYVAAFLKEKGIKFEIEVPLYGLKGDSKSYRVVDFKLTKLGVYVEYFGQYNASKLKRNEYDQKAEVYIRNNIPTVFIYPHELGFLDYAFHSKMVKLLKIKKFNLRKSLFKYRMDRYFENGNSGSFSVLIVSSVFAYGLTHNTGLSADFTLALFIVSLCLIFISLKEIVLDVWRYFYKDK
jgi:hypothetical protein